MFSVYFEMFLLVIKSTLVAVDFTITFEGYKQTLNVKSKTKHVYALLILLNWHTCLRNYHSLFMVFPSQPISFSVVCI